jgi:acyl-coenzyme A synthetase/AMP-(fatty) acid ligase
MLYDRWRQIVDQQPHEMALVDCPAGRRWTFRQLADQTERNSPAAPHEAIISRGMSSSFIFDVLRAWRTGALLRPLEEGQDAAEIPPPPRGCVHLKTTSASTGAPRLVSFTAEQLAADADQIVATMGLRREWPNVGVISLAHSYGFSNLVLPLLLHGIPLILGGSPLPESVRRAAKEARETTLPGVPALWRTWFDAGPIPRSVRLAISAGAPLPLALEEAVFQRCGLKIHNFYGASECGGIAYDAMELPRQDPRCAGAAMKGVELFLCEDGCLGVRSRAVGETYWPCPEPALAHGVYQTSDLARLEGGLVWLLGRQSDLINIAGRKVSPESIEHALARHPDVRHCLVFGVPSKDADRTETIVACVAALPTTTTAALKQHLLSIIPAWQVPRHWWLVPALDTNARGKLARNEWRRKYLEQHRR